MWKQLRDTFKQYQALLRTLEAGCAYCARSCSNVTATSTSTR